VRTFQIGQRFQASQRAHAPEGSPEWRAVSRVLSELADDRLPLPGADDYETMIPPTKRCMGRPVRSAGLVVCYSVLGAVVHVLAVKRPP
jgi:hypothetical protein